MSSKQIIREIEVKLAAHLETRNTPHNAKPFRELAEELEFLPKYISWYPDSADEALIAALAEVGVLSSSQRLNECAALALWDILGPRIHMAKAAFAVFRGALDGVYDKTRRPNVRSDALYMADTLIHNVSDNVGEGWAGEGFVKSVGRTLLEEPDSYLKNTADRILSSLLKKKALPIVPIIDLLKETFTEDDIFWKDSIVSFEVAKLIKKIGPLCSTEQKEQLILPLIERELQPFIKKPSIMETLPSTYYVSDGFRDMFFTPSFCYERETRVLLEDFDPTLENIVTLRLRKMTAALCILIPSAPETKERIRASLETFSKEADKAKNEVAGIAVRQIWETVQCAGDEQSFVLEEVRPPAGSKRDMPLENKL